MSRLTTADGKRLGYLTLDLDGGEQSTAFLILVDAEADMVLKATPADADLTIEGAIIQPPLPIVYVDLVTTGIDFSSTGAGQYEVSILVTAADPLSGDGIRRIVEYLALTKNTPALWAA